MTYQNKGELVNMLRKLFQSLPFVYHRPPLTIPLRKVTLLAIQRPVKIKHMEKLIVGKLKKNESETINGLEIGIEYLRRERFFKKDSANLFVAGLSTRACLGLIEAVKAYAMIQGREFAIIEDVQALFPYLVAHRLEPVNQSMAPELIGQQIIEAVALEH